MVKAWQIGVPPIASPEYSARKPTLTRCRQCLGWLKCVGNRSEWWCLLGELCFLYGFWLVTHQSYLYAHFRGVQSGPPRLTPYQLAIRSLRVSLSVPLFAPSKGYLKREATLPEKASGELYHKHNCSRLITKSHMTSLLPQFRGSLWRNSCSYLTKFILGYWDLEVGDNSIKFEYLSWCKLWWAVVNLLKHQGWWQCLHRKEVFYFQQLVCVLGL
jgi:hypothetical protein